MLLHTTSEQEEVLVGIVLGGMIWNCGVHRGLTNGKFNWKLRNDYIESVNGKVNLENWKDAQAVEDMSGCLFIHWPIIQEHTKCSRQSEKKGKQKETSGGNYVKRTITVRHTLIILIACSFLIIGAESCLSVMQCLHFLQGYTCENGILQVLKPSWWQKSVSPALLFLVTARLVIHTPVQ